MKLFLIGNGFDIGHNLLTKYWHFRTFLLNKYPDFLNSFEKQYNIYPWNDERKNDLLWSRFETNLANIDEDTIINDGVSINLDLESGDVGIEDTLYHHFSLEYEYINELAIYLKEWVASIKLDNCAMRTSIINSENKDIFLSFNYTNVLEEVYGINPNKIVHIHGSLNGENDNLVLGHGNIDRIINIKDRITKARNMFSEKESSIYSAIKDYYDKTYKDIGKNFKYLSIILENRITEIILIGLSLEGIDMPYFSLIDQYTGKRLMWHVYCYDMNEASSKKHSLINAGIDESRIKLESASNFYNL